MDSKVPFSRLALIGVGYIGGSAALAARRAGLVGSVTGYDVDAKAGPLALSRGVVDEMADSAEAAVAGASLVLLAAPVLNRLKPSSVLAPRSISAKRIFRRI